ncbi:hypothetical protein ACXR0O_19160 [Verrucomicrobiota bacterium sgz303538]
MDAEKRVVLITQGARISRSIANLEAKLAKIEAELVTLPKGTYKNEKGESCQVIEQQPGATKYKLSSEEIEAKARELCGPRRFNQLFDRLVIHQPCKEFAAVAARVLKDKAAALVALCSVAGAPGKKYVRWQ